MTNTVLVYVISLHNGTYSGFNRRGSNVFFPNANPCFRIRGFVACVLSDNWCT